MRSASTAQRLAEINLGSSSGVSQLLETKQATITMVDSVRFVSTAIAATSVRYTERLGRREPRSALPAPCPRRLSRRKHTEEIADETKDIARLDRAVGSTTT
jgi:hypothetical protein